MRQHRYSVGRLRDKVPVGEVRPSQMLYSYGVGAIVDLPKMAAMVMGLDEWDAAQCQPLEEARLLAAVQSVLTTSVQSLRLPPVQPDTGAGGLDDNRIGVPVATYPRWLVCPFCRLLAPISSTLFELKDNPFRKEYTAYVHRNCPRAPKDPDAIPVRFLLACEKGHLDDFPWRIFAHHGATSCNAPLRLIDYGVSGEAADVIVRCDACGVQQSMSNAFGEDAAKSVPQQCTGRRPHLRDHDSTRCDGNVKTILLGASNAWFPLTLSTLYIPNTSDPLAQLVQQNWAQLSSIPDKSFLSLYRTMPVAQAVFGPFLQYTDDELFAAIDAQRNSQSGPEPEDPRDIKTPEWRILSHPDASKNGPDFELNPVAPPIGYEAYFEKVVLVERLREVKALVGFTRIESPGEIYDTQDFPEDQRAPLCRQSPTWVPATEIRGEGIFLEFKPSALLAWAAKAAVVARNQQFYRAHQQWRLQRGINPDANYPEIGFVLLHSFAHALMRQLVLDCGYTSASVRERIYWPKPNATEAMAGVLIYTGAPDSEGTLGGLVSLGAPSVLSDHISQALELSRLCTSDPLCAEHVPEDSSITLHAAACHSCMFVPETSCEASNLYLDRSLLVPTLERDDLAFFDVGDAS